MIYMVNSIVDLTLEDLEVNTLTLEDLEDMVVLEYLVCHLIFHFTDQLKLIKDIN